MHSTNIYKGFMARPWDKLEEWLKRHDLLPPGAGTELDHSESWFSPSRCLVPSPRGQRSRLCGFTGEFWPPRAPVLHPIHTVRNSGQVFPFRSLAWHLETLRSHLAERRKDRMLQRWCPRSFGITPSPNTVAWPFLHNLWSETWIFLASLSLPLPYPPPGSWQRQRSHSGLTVRIAPFFSDNKIQQPFGIPAVPQSPDPWLGPRGFVVGC